MHLPLPARVLSKLIQVIGYVSSSRDDIFSVTAKQMLDMFAIDACMFAVCEPEGMRIVAVESKKPGIVESLMGRRLEHPCAAFEDGLLMCVDNADEDSGCEHGLICRWARSYLCLPLTTRGERMGTMSVASEQSHSFSPEEIDLYLALASLVAISVQNTDLYHQAAENERELRRQVDERTQVLEELNHFAKRINAATTRDEVYAVIGSNIDKIVPCDGATIALRDPRGIVSVRPLRGEPYLLPQADVDVAETVLSNVEITLRARVQTGSPPPRARRLVGGKTGSYSIVPMTTAGKMVGSLNVWRFAKPDLSHSDLPILTQISAHIAAALARVQVYEHERTIAQTFQESLLPKRDYTFQWLSIAGKYEAALSEADVGGDFYDIIPIDQNRIGIAVGDISGKGLAAAIRAAETKYMLQAYAVEDPSPDVVLRRLNNAVCHSFADLFATLFYGVVNLADGVLTYANAGHEMPVRIRQGASIQALDVTGPAVAVFPNACYEQRKIRIEPHDLILCYTDGITEARRSGDIWGYDRLVKALGNCHSLQPIEVVDYVYKSAHEFANGRLADDVVLMAIARS